MTTATTAQAMHIMVQKAITFWPCTLLKMVPNSSEQKPYEAVSEPTTVARCSTLSFCVAVVIATVNKPEVPINHDHHEQVRMAMVWSKPENNQVRVASVGQKFESLQHTVRALANAEIENTIENIVELEW
jgi:hypothetical protein